MSVGKYMHEVLVEAHLDDIIYYMAVKDLEYKEERSAQARATARAKSR